MAEILRDEKFKNSFQIGMLSSFESFLETIGKRSRAARLTEEAAIQEEDGLRKVKIFSRPTSFYCATSCNRHGKQKSALVEPVR